MTKFSTLRLTGLAVAALVCGLAFGAAARADALDDITKAGVLNVGVFARLSRRSRRPARHEPQGL